MLCSVLHQVTVSVPFRQPFVELIWATSQLLMLMTAVEKRLSPVSNQYSPNASATQAALPEYSVPLSQIIHSNTKEVRIYKQVQSTVRSGRRQAPVQRYRPGGLTLIVIGQTGEQESENLLSSDEIR